MVSKAASLAALERLPEKIRREITFAALTWEVPNVLAQYRRAEREIGQDRAEQWMIESIRAADMREILRDAREYARRYGTLGACVAADVEPIMGYRPPVYRKTVRRPPLRGAVRAAFEASDRLIPKNFPSNRYDT